MRDVAEWILSAVSGDVRVVGRLAAVHHSQLVNAASQAGRLIVTTKAVRRALESYRRGEVSATELNSWAWFLRRGYIPYTRGPVCALKIAYEPDDAQDAIVSALARFSELGDKVDGTLEPGELDQLARRLGSE